RSPAELDSAFVSVATKKIGAITTINDPMYWNERERIAKLAIAHNIAVAGHTAEMTQAGMLFSYAANYSVMFRRIAFYIDKILKGASPAEIPVEQPTRFEFVINAKTAKAIGLALSPTLLARADEVIE